jgi:hypothetical protein
MKKISYYNLDKIQNRSLDIIIFITYVIYISLALGIYIISPEYINIFHTFVKLYICAFLIYRFNPWRKISCQHLDKRIAFIAGFLLLSTTIFENILQYYLSKTKNTVKTFKNKKETNENNENNENNDLQ